MKSKPETAAPSRSLVIVRPSVMEAMAVIASKEETRYYLCGVYIQPHKDGGLVLVATDGHIIVVVRDYQGYAEGAPQIWDFPGHAAIVKAKLSTIDKKRKTTALLRYEQIGTRFKVGMAFDNHADDLKLLEFDDPVVELVADKVAIDGTYPDYVRIIPQIDDARSGFALNSALLQRIGKFAEKLTGIEGVPVNFEPTSAERGCNFRIVSASQEIDACCVAMPIKGERLFYHPSWFVDHTGRTDLGVPAPAPIDRSSKEDEPDKAAVAA